MKQKRLLLQLREEQCGSHDQLDIERKQCGE